MCVGLQRFQSTVLVYNLQHAGSNPLYITLHRRVLTEPRTPTVHHRPKSTPHPRTPESEPPPRSNYYRCSCRVARCGVSRCSRRRSQSRHGQEHGRQRYMGRTPLAWRSSTLHTLPGILHSRGCWPPFPASKSEPPRSHTRSPSVAALQMRRRQGAYRWSDDSRSQG